MARISAGAPEASTLPFTITVSVTDDDETGTTLYTAPYDAFEPHFGGGSRVAHLDSGAREIPGELTSLRRDVDDRDALRQAEQLGVGAHTRLAMLA